MSIFKTQKPKCVNYMVHLREFFFFIFMGLYLVSGAELGTRGVKNAQDPFSQRHSEPAACFHLAGRLWENIPICMALVRQRK